MEGRDVMEVQREVKAISQKLSGLVSELDERRREMFNVKRHPRRAAGAAVAAASLLAGIVVLLVARHRRRNSLQGRLTALRESFRRIAKHPERLANPEAIGRKSAAAAGAAAASVFGRRFAQRLVG